MTKNRTTTTKNKKDVKPGLFARWWAALTGVTARVVVAVCIAILVLFVASSLVSFVSSGGADSSVVEAGSGVDLNSVDNGVQSCTGSLGMRIAMYLMNGCFGWAAFAMFPFFVALIVKLVGWRSPRLSKWFIGSVFGAIWGSIFFSFAFGEAMAGSFMSPGGQHGENVSQWLVSQIGGLGITLLLFVTLLLFMIYLTRNTIIWLKKAFSFGATQVGKLKRPSSPDDDESDEATYGAHLQKEGRRCPAKPRNRRVNRNAY